MLAFSLENYCRQSLKVPEFHFMTTVGTLSIRHNHHSNVQQRHVHTTEPFYQEPPHPFLGKQSSKDVSKMRPQDY